MRRLARADLVSFALLAVSAFLVFVFQLPLREDYLRLREEAEAYLLPPPEHLVVGSLGYRAAFADVLWANVLVTQGLRLEQRRRYETVGDYLDAINELDPKFREPYLHSDTLLTFQAKEVPLSEVFRARRVLERGVRERPLDAELWLQLGQFCAYIAAPSYLKDPAEQQRWREQGAEYLARAAELGAANPDIQWQAIGGAGILTRAGQRDAAIRFYRRTLATTEDEELRAHVEMLLRRLEDEQARERYESRKDSFVSAWRRAYPGRSADFVLLGGPPFEAAACAGGSAAAHADDARCATTWVEWARRLGFAEPR